MTLVLSRKINLTINRNLQSIMEDSFSEREIKELLVDLRQLARQFISNISLDSVNKDIHEEKYLKQIKLFVDICDSIAHPNRDRGFLRDKIIENLQSIQAHLNSGEIKFEKAIVADSIVGALLGMINLYIISFDKNFYFDIKKIYSRKDGIALCIISLLQDVVVMRLCLKKDHDNKECVSCTSASLYFEKYEERFILSCHVVKPKISYNRQQLNLGQESVSFNFPLIMTNFKANLDFTVDQYSRSIPAIVEIVRGDDNLLKAVELVDKYENVTENNKEIIN